MQRRRLLLLLLLVAAIALAALGIRWLLAPGRQLTKAFDGPASFSLRYPDGWMAVIPEQGIMIVAEPDTLGGQPGPSLTIQRSEALMLEGSLSSVLETYLERGPEVRNRGWQRLTEITPRTLPDGREAVTIDLFGRELEQDPDMRVRLVVTRADNMVVYVMGISAPPKTWDEDEPLLMAMLDSIRFAE
ncbi:MAG: hypothetical protein JXN59_01245 [Anaerolineae bacterium]|nr:hypothetical protein [Anaerolineae bacterium]